ncbi:MAG: aldehyde dehydrogenase family protein [Bdellovibrionaceae bacterium]|nr:aldehyde dehydrogenase family protein [Pseudobdellovibrionaceae bacterium]
MFYADVSAGRLSNWIHGEPRGPVSGRYLSLQEPRRTEASGELPDSDLMDIVAAVKAANSVAPEWARLDFHARADRLEAWADVIVREKRNLAELSSFETGQSVADAEAFDILLASDSLRQIARLLREPESPQEHRLPAGLSGLIAPATEPVFHTARRLAAAIGGGGPVIVKPSSSASRAVLRFAELSLEARIPAGVVNVVCGRGAEVGEALVSHPGIGRIAFVGSSEVGARIRILAAEHGKRLHLGMGGRNAILVFADADLEVQMPEIVRTLFDVHHETAWRGSRVFVQGSVSEAFLEALMAHTKAWLPNLAPLPRKRWAERFLAATKQSKQEKGKSLFADLEAPKHGHYVAPFVSVDLTLCSTLQQEEVLGPFASIGTFKYPHEAVKYANLSPLGQAAYVFSEDEEKALKTAQKIEAGRVFVNSGPVRDLQAEATPLKNSGIGGDGPRALLDFFSHRILIHMPALKT